VEKVLAALKQSAIIYSSNKGDKTMRLSIDTLILLGRLGDEASTMTAIFLDKNRDAEAWSMNGGRIGAGWL
jgi:hypothetical protein